MTSSPESFTEQFRLGDAKRYAELARIQPREASTDIVLELWGLQQSHHNDKVFWKMVASFRHENQQFLL